MFAFASLFTIKTCMIASTAIMATPAVSVLVDKLVYKPFKEKYLTEQPQQGWNNYMADLTGSITPDYVEGEFTEVVEETSTDSEEYYDELLSELDNIGAEFEEVIENKQQRERG